MQQTDESLIAQCAQGRKEAFEELYRRYGDRIASYLYRCLGNVDQAEELCQETFARVWIRANQCDPSRGRFRAWMYQIATNLVRSHWRKAERTRLVDLPETVEPKAQNSHLSPPPDLPGQDVIREQKDRLVHQALKELKADHRIVITLKYFEQMKIRDIAPLVGCSEGTVKSRLHHGLRYMAEKLRSLGLCEEDVG